MKYTTSMKYLTLLLLISCAQKPNCETREMGKILGDLYTLLECRYPPKESNVKCDPYVTKQGTVLCVRKG